MLIGMGAGTVLTLIGTFAGAWLTYRKQIKASPMPTVFKMPGATPDNEDYLEKVDENKRIGV